MSDKKIERGCPWRCVLLRDVTGDEVLQSAHIGFGGVHEVDATGIAVGELEVLVLLPHDFPLEASLAVGTADAIQEAAGWEDEGAGLEPPEWWVHDGRSTRA